MNGITVSVFSQVSSTFVRSGRRARKTSNTVPSPASALWLSRNRNTSAR